MTEYIDREAAKKEFNLNFGGVSHAVIASRILDAIPAADVAPVVHAKWIVTEQENSCAVWNNYTCSVCGSVFDGKDWLFDEWKGCPVCLARMDGDE